MNNHVEEREKKYDFADPYCYIRTALIVRSDNEDITCFEDLNGKATANSIASTYMTLAESFGASATGVDTLDQTIELVLAGRVDATLNAEVSYYDYLSVHPEAEIKIVDLTEEASHVAIPLCKGEDNASLLAAVNKAIGELSEDGTLAELSPVWSTGLVLAELSKDGSVTSPVEALETSPRFGSTAPVLLSSLQLTSAKKLDTTTALSRFFLNILLLLIPIEIPYVY